MFTNIYRRKDGRYEARIALGKGIEGKRIYRSIYGRTAEEVEVKLAAICSRDYTITEITVKEITHEYLASLKPQIKESYDIIMNSSGLNNIMPSNDNLNEIKVQNMKEEMKSIINNSGGSSGRRKREKRKVGKKHKNMTEFANKEEQKGIQNELKEQIKQFVIEEHNSNNDNTDNNGNNA